MSGQHTISRIVWPKVLPWLRLFEAIRLAIGFRALTLGILAWLLATQGLGLIESWAGPAVPAQEPSVGHGPPEWIISRAEHLMHPYVSVGSELFSFRRSAADWKELGVRVLRLSWLLVVFSLFGGAITRGAALQFAGRGGAGLRRQLRFAALKFPHLILAPLLPFVIVAGVRFGGIAFGAITRLGDFGAGFVSVFWWLPLVAGFGLVLLLGVTAIAWPFMIAVNAAEDSDCFDNFSRAVNFVLSRPLRTALHVVLLIPAAWMTVVPLEILVEESLASAVALTDPGLDENVRTGISAATTDPNAVPADHYRSAHVWARVARTVPAGFAVSLFWSWIAISGLLLRHSVDAIEIDEVYVATEDDAAEIPLVGRAAHPVADH